MRPARPSLTSASSLLTRSTALRDLRLRSFYEHPGKHAAIIAWFLADHPDGNIAQLIKWYKKQREDEAFQRRLLDAA